jgi:hypothetical protein
MVHVVWQLRTGAEPTGEPVEDQIVFPEECSLREVGHSAQPLLHNQPGCAAACWHGHSVMPAVWHGHA